MKDLLKLKSSLSEKIENILNEQIKLEAHASSLYLSMSSWCDDQGLENAAQFFANQSDEEREHMLKFFNYVNDRGGRAISPEINRIPVDFDSFKSVFEQTLAQEMHVTEQINNIAHECVQVRDYTTFSFLQWFLEEQIEEEYVARRILELFDVIGESGTGRWEIDKQILHVEYQG